MSLFDLFAPAFERLFRQLQRGTDRLHARRLAALSPRRRKDVLRRYRKGKR